ncbi:hypothetical protein [Streptomyces sp. H39-S7]|uniref:hypothetical protein n=1 Tax=Streptomyces sp. H39-S7 TaxID=3004357 RepID=UPI0022AF13B1|nr:hypothetical protein [Streptomyces sp. H39-S7]MCZ4123975.1 hypothetical protein [Streptomyces sp. H39-S7]
MTTRPKHPGGELIPRPARTPDALRVALARIAPHRLEEMDRQKNEAFSMAVQHDTIGPMRMWLLMWSGEVEIERRPDLYERRRNAEESAAALPPEAPAWRAAMDEIVALTEEARSP